MNSEEAPLVRIAVALESIAESLCTIINSPGSAKSDKEIREMLGLEIIE